jgi:hypothetical protein
MPGVDETEVPRSALIAARLAVAVAATGLLLIVAGLLDLHWWGTSSAHELRRVFEQVRIEYGDQPPALLRAGGGAVELIVLGICCLPYAFLAPLIRKGRRWARTTALLLGLATFIVGLIEIGADATQPVDLHAYLVALGNKGATSPVPQITSVIYPGWYNWVEDAAQGLQALASLALVITLTGLSVWHPYFFAGKTTAAQAPDEWSEAISRIRDQNARRRTETGLDD